MKIFHFVGFDSPRRKLYSKNHLNIQNYICKINRFVIKLLIREVCCFLILYHPFLKQRLVMISEPLYLGCMTFFSKSNDKNLPKHLRMKVYFSVKLRTIYLQVYYKTFNYSYCQELFIRNPNLNSRLRFLENIINQSKNYSTYSPKP